MANTLCSKPPSFAQADARSFHKESSSGLDQKRQPVESDPHVIGNLYFETNSISENREAKLEEGATSLLPLREVRCQKNRLTLVSQSQTRRERRTLYFDDARF